MPVSFHKQSIRFRLSGSPLLKQWISTVIQLEGKKPGDIAIVFCSDNYLLQMNQEHLQHDYYTDVITFDYTQDEIISGDIFISVDRVKDNALTEGVHFELELRRVMIHGILHLLGYKDKKKKDVEVMRLKENQALTLFSSLDVPRGT